METTLSNFAPNFEKTCDQPLNRTRQADRTLLYLLENMPYFGYDVTSALAIGKAIEYITGGPEEVTYINVRIFTPSFAMGTVHHMPWLMKALCAV